MTIHNFGPIHHSESPTSMNMTGWVDDDGNYSITFATNFANGESNASLNSPNFSGNFCNLPMFLIVPFAVILGFKTGNVRSDSELCVNSPAVIALPKICRTHTK